MTDPPRKKINITIENVGVLIVGDNIKVSIRINDDLSLDRAITPQDVVMLDKLVEKITNTRKVDALHVQQDLAAALSTPDFSFVTKENLQKATQILNSWAGSSVRTAINDQAH